MDISIGRDSITRNEFSIDSTKHINIEGMSGMGKSTLLVNLFIEHILQGDGGLFIDPHSDTADQIAKLIPKSRMRDFIWIDPDASLVPPFNPLHFNSPEELELGKESLFTTFKSLAGSAWGDESARVIINAIDAVCEYYDHPTPVHIFRFMADDKFREKILAATENPLLQMFKEQYDEKLRDSEQMSNFSPPINKVGKLLRPSIIPIIGQPQSLDFLEIMNKKKIVVCRFSKGRLGEEIAQILGSLIVSMVLCDGSSYSTSTYPSLFALIGYTYGGSTSTFGVPNLGGRTIFGPSANESTTIGATGGATSTNVLSNVVGNNSGVSYSSGGAGCGGQGCPLLSVTNNTTTASIIPSYIILQYIIKF